MNEQALDVKIEKIVLGFARIEEKLDHAVEDLKQIKIDNKELSNSRVRTETQLISLKETQLQHGQQIDQLFHKTREAADMAKDVNRKITFGVTVGGIIVTSAWAIFTFLAGKK